MPSCKPGSAQEHYENLLADHYEWMFGLPFEAKVAEQKAILDEFAGPAVTGGLPVDLGCGSRFPCIALSSFGYKVLAIGIRAIFPTNHFRRIVSQHIFTNVAALRHLNYIVCPPS